MAKQKQVTQRVIAYLQKDHKLIISVSEAERDLAFLRQTRWLGQRDGSGWEPLKSLARSNL